MCVANSREAGEIHGGLVYNSQIEWWEPLKPTLNH